MWKKFLAVMAMVGVLSTQTAIAADPVEGGPIELTPLIAGVEMSTDIFNPAEDAPIELAIRVNEDAFLKIDLRNAETQALVTTLVPSASVTSADTFPATFDGVVSNEQVADGEYYFSILAGTAEHKTQTVDEYFTVVSGPVALTVESLDASNEGVLDLTIDSSITFTCSVNLDATVELAIYNEEGDLVRTLTSDTCEFTWDGRDSEGDLVDAEMYTATLTATTADETATSSVTVEVKYDGGAGSDILTNIEFSDNPWDPSEDELDIEFEFEEDIEEFTLTAELVGENDDVELWDDEEMDADKYEMTWNGLDDDDDYIEEGTWNFMFELDGEVVYGGSVLVDYEEPQVEDDLFVTKESFDNTIGEFTYVVFRVDADALVTVEVMDGSKEVVTLMEEEEVSKDDWYAVKWDGMDDDSDEVDEDTYEFRVTAMNIANDDVESFREIDVEVKEDEVSSSKANATNDAMYPVIVDKNTDSPVEMEFTIDEEAEVTVEIFEGGKSSNPEITLLDDELLPAGDYKLNWDARDEDGKKLDKNEKYSYRVTARVVGSSNKTDKERGYFVIGTEGTDPVDPVDPVDPTDGCGFWDVTTSSEYCEAIAWSKSAGIFDGYTEDGSFRQYDFISRAESLKVVLEAFDVPILPSNYSTLGFTDVNPYGWYVKYLRTGKFYGMTDGYKGTTFVKPHEEINRVELLKYVLEASETVKGYDVPVCNVTYYSDTDTSDWYKDYVCFAHDYDLYNTYAGYFYPGNNVSRGEVALLLYRLSNAGLLQ
jgi:flagellar hook assembly protein FlgD